MKHPVLIILALLMYLPLAAYEVQLIPVLQVNTRDQVDNVLPKYGISLTSRVRKVERFQPFQIEIPLIIEERLARPLTIRATLTGTGPDGRKDNGFENIVLFELPAGAQGVFFPKIGISSHFSAADKLGVHRFELIYSDGSQEKRVAFEIELTGDISDLSDMNEREFNELTSSYYRSPKPHRLKVALTNYLEYFSVRKSPGGGAVADQMGIYKWFVEVFKLNPQFHGFLADLSRSVKPAHREVLGLIFAGLGSEVIEQYRSKLHPEVLEIALSPQSQSEMAVSQVSSPEHLDMLMAEFLATGRFAPVLQIVNELRQRDKISVDEARQRPGGINGLSEADRRLLMNGLLEQCAVWMLRSNIRQRHTLLKYYLETILHRNQYADRYGAEQIISILTSN